MGAWRGWIAGAVVALAVGVAVSGGAASPQSAPKPGGVFRVAFEASFGFTDSFDPTGEYYVFSWAIESNLMIRTLVGYDHVAGPAGNVLVPDIATSVPKAADGGKTYTFHLKHGVKFGPPVDREVTSAGRPVRVRADRAPQGRGRVRLLLLPDRRLRRLCRREGEDDLRDQDTGPEHDRLPPHEADG